MPCNEVRVSRNQQVMYAARRALAGSAAARRAQPPKPPSGTPPASAYAGSPSEHRTGSGVSGDVPIRPSRRAAAAGATEALPPKKEQASTIKAFEASIDLKYGEPR